MRSCIGECNIIKFTERQDFQSKIFRRIISYKHSFLCEKLAKTNHKSVEKMYESKSFWVWST